MAAKPIKSLEIALYNDSVFNNIAYKDQIKLEPHSDWSPFDVQFNFCLPLLNIVSLDYSVVYLIYLIYCPPLNKCPPRTNTHRESPKS